ncbi:MAG: fluoride efflux transporter CrcB [Cyanobacteria bacterium P01_H01_bin.121]
MNNLWREAKFRAAIAIALGAIAGALGRYYAGQWFDNLHPGNFPLGTFVVNVSGCYLMGLISTYATRTTTWQPELILLLTTGCLGSYTTFSSYELDTAQLLDQPGLLADLVYWVGSPLLGLGGLGLGIATTNWFLARRTSQD